MLLKKCGTCQVLCEAGIIIQTVFSDQLRLKQPVMVDVFNLSNALVLKKTSMADQSDIFQSSAMFFIDQWKISSIFLICEVSKELWKHNWVNNTKATVPLNWLYIVITVSPLTQIVTLSNQQ